MRLTGKASVSSFLAFLLNVACYGVATIIVIASALTVISLFIDIHGAEIDLPVSFHVNGRALPINAASLGIEAHIHDAHGSLKFRPPKGNLVVPAVLLGVTVMLGIVLWGLSQLKAVFRTLRDGQPFVAANAIRIRSVALIVIFGELARTALMFAANLYATTHFSASGLQFDAQPDLNFLAIIHGLIILVIAEVFRTGTQLDEDQSLTI
ncbi:MAG TPA: DUF2975 domain-containing protein [Vicinamibacterales bacterium]|nr:DUF2975 domain-containing protein [Vicinamibacterales bacterium]